MTLIDPPTNPNIGDNYATRFWDGQKWQCPPVLTGLLDAPRDGNIYGRQNGTWQRSFPYNGGELLDLLIDYDLNVMGNANVNGVLTVIGNAGIEGSLTVNQPSIFNSYLDVTGALNVGGIVTAPTVSAVTVDVGNTIAITDTGFESSSNIGFTSPNIDFYGTVNESNNLNVGSGIDVVNGGVTASQPMYAPAFNVTSDVRLKENIHDCLMGLPCILGLRPRHFHRKNSSHQEFGLIAQEVQEVLPSAIRGDDKLLSINPMAVIAVLINAVKELAERVEHMERSHA